jgi:PncC family amidohydrolase
MDFINVKIDKKEASRGELYDVATKAVQSLLDAKMTFSSAESCTGGLVGGTVTAVSGSSAVYFGGIITYTNDIKINVLGIDSSLIDEYTEVSAPVARQMAERVREKLSSDIGVSATGFAGPTGGNENDPVGTVYVGIADKNNSSIYRLSYSVGTEREEIRLMTVQFILEKLALIVNK